jgi:hypothetical protein
MAGHGEKKADRASIPALEKNKWKEVVDRTVRIGSKGDRSVGQRPAAG